MLVSPAFAQAASGGGFGGGLGGLVPLVLIFVIMYFLMIRPQQQKIKKHRAMVEALRKGDRIVTAGGLKGKVTKINAENEIEVEIASGVKVAVVQHTIQDIVSKPEPAKTSKSKKS